MQNYEFLLNLPYILRIFMRLLILFNNIVCYGRHVVTKVGLSYCISRRGMGAIGLTDKANILKNKTTHGV